MKIVLKGVHAKTVAAVLENIVAGTVTVLGLDFINPTLGLIGRVEVLLMTVALYATIVYLKGFDED